jgi:hypothetical protein
MQTSYLFGAPVSPSGRKRGKCQSCNWSYIPDCDRIGRRNLKGIAFVGRGCGRRFLLSNCDAAFKPYDWRQAREDETECRHIVENEIERCWPLLGPIIIVELLQKTAQLRRGFYAVLGHIYDLGAVARVTCDGH